MVRLRKSGGATGGESDSVKRTHSESNQTGKKKVALFLCFIGVCLFLAVFGPEQSSKSQLTSLYQEAALDQVRGQQQSKAAVSFKKRCPIGSTIVLLFPHVNKAGGRTVEATFGDLSQIASERRHRYISARPRSKTHKFDIVDHHKPYPTLALRNQCYDKSSVVQSNCEQTTPSSCKRWVFTLRNPIKRTISAFYTTTGRPVPPRPPHVPGLDASSTFSGPLHFPCAPGSKAAELLQDPNSSINDWASLPYEERLACKGAFNTHVKYLAPDKKEGSLQQFEAAKARLSAMSWFGILERWSESLHLFSYALGTDLVHFTPTYNVNSYDNKPSLETLRILQAHNAMDMELFEFASELFKQRLEAMRQDKLDPFYFNELPFTCGTTRICWDKSTTGDFWEMGAVKDLKATKGSVICTDKAGCTRNDMSASNLDQITLPLPGTKLEDYLAQSSNSKKALAQINTPQNFQVASESSERNPRWPISKCLGSFFILGARKGGTTSLYTYIAQHPKFAGVNLNSGAQAGELLFLHLESSKRNKNLRVEGIRERYDEAFLKALVKDFGGSKLEWEKNIYSGELMTGESSVANGPGCAVPELMQNACGNDIRLVYLVRNPIDRIVSQYKMRERKGTLDSPPRIGWTIEQHVIADLDDIEDLLEREGLSGSWWETQASIPCLYKNDYENSVWSSMYIVHLKRWTQLYSPDKLRVIRSEEMFLNPAATVRNVTEFIGLDSKDFDAEEIVVDAFNTAPQTTTRTEILSDATEKRLAQFFMIYNDALRGDFGINVQGW